MGLYAETVLQTVQDGTNDTYYGRYLAVDYAGSGFGVVVDFKDYNFKKYGAYASGGVTSSEPLAYQNPPLVQREFTTNLLAKHPHVPVYDDEAGFQVEGTFQPLEPLSVTANFSRSSLHRGEELIPSLHEEDAPFWQFFMEGEYVFPQGHFAGLGVGANEEVKVTGPEASRVSYLWQQKQAVALEGTYFLTPLYGLTGHLEAMRLKDNIEVEDFMEYYAAATLSRAPWGSVTVSFETTGDPDEREDNWLGQSYWLGFEMDVNFLQNHNLLLFAGQDRGGIKCTSGRCRYVDPFEGIKLTLRSTF
jgi:hypothetical protein